MKSILKKTYILAIMGTKFVAAVLATSLVLVACNKTNFNREVENDTIYKETNNTQDIYLDIQENNYRKEVFDEYVSELFREEASESLLYLHYIVSDNSAYGIKGYDSYYGDISKEAFVKKNREYKNIADKIIEYKPYELDKDRRLILEVIKEDIA